MGESINDNVENLISVKEVAVMLPSCQQFIAQSENFFPGSAHERIDKKATVHLLVYCAS